MRNATTMRTMVRRDDHDLGRQDEVGADGLGDDLVLVDGLGGDVLGQVLGRGLLAVGAAVREGVMDLLRALVGQVEAAEDEQDRHRDGQEL